MIWRKSSNNISLAQVSPLMDNLRTKNGAWACLSWKKFFLKKKYVCKSWNQYIKLKRVEIGYGFWYVIWWNSSALLLNWFGLALPGRFTKPRTTSHATFKRIHRTDGEFPLATNTVATNKLRLEAMGRFSFLAPLPLAGTAQREGCKITQPFHHFIPHLFTRVKCLWQT